MGSKGSNTTTQQSQGSQTYAPTGAGYITNALNQAQNAAQLPFNIPQAPVAGFGQLQQQAFGGYGNLGNISSPYTQQAANYFSPQGTQAFFNPFAANVMSGLQDVFGQQQSQNTGNLVQSAGGVGADRIAVGQANLAHQQDLAAGQTLAGLYGQAQGMAQTAGQNTANLGFNAQNAQQSALGAQLGAGGLQQQLAQAQLNSPYQQQLLQAQFPYQQAQFLAGITGALAPGLGGTTYGTQTGQTTTPAPSIWSQILGGGAAAAGLAGGFSGSAYNPFGSSPSYGGGNMFSGDAYGGSGSNPLPGLTAADYGAGYAEGGEVSDEPIDVARNPFIPAGKIAGIQPHIPQLNLSAPQPAQQQSGGGGPGISDALKIAAMFMSRGGAAHNPFYADGGDIDLEDRFAPVREAIASGDFDPQGMNSTTFDGSPSMVAANRSMVPPLPAARPADAPAVEDDAEAGPTDVSAQARQPAAPAPASGRPERDTGFIGSPWAALTAAGLGIMSGTSPYAGVNIGKGGLQGLQALEQQRAASQKDETIDQAAQRLDQEAQQHLDSMTKMTPYQQGMLKVAQTKAAANSGSDTSVSDIVDAIESGDQSPSLTGLYGKSAAVRAEAARRGIPLAKMQNEWAAAQRQIASLNGSQMQRFIGLSNSVTNTIDEVKALAEQMHNSGIPLINRAKLAALVQTEGNSPRGQLAQRYLTSVNTLKSEFANLEAGGFAPHESVWQLANQQISGDFGEKQMGAALDEVQRLVKYRINAIPNINTLGPGAANRYTGQGAPSAPNGGGKAPVVFQNGHEYHLQPDGSYQ